MPKPIVCLSEQVRQYMEIFRSCFSKCQWKYFVIVLLGLVECEERKTMTGLLRVIGKRISLSGLSRFLSKWPWSPEQVAQTWIDRFREQMKPLVQVEHARLRAERPQSIGCPRATVVTEPALSVVEGLPDFRRLGACQAQRQKDGWPGVAFLEHGAESGPRALSHDWALRVAGEALSPSGSHVPPVFRLRGGRRTLSEQS